MTQRFARILGATAVLMTLFSGPLSAVFKPADAFAMPQRTCWYCESDGERMFCVRVECPTPI